MSNNNRFWMSKKVPSLNIQEMKNECADYISRNNFDALIGAPSEALAKEAFSRMDVHLDLNMTMIRPLDELQQ